VQTLLEIMMSANLREAKNKGKFLEESTLALCNHPTEEELSPKLRKQSSFSMLPWIIACQIVTIDATNSRQLFLFLRIAEIFLGF
jgi:hypothetical protein